MNIDLATAIEIVLTIKQEYDIETIWADKYAMEEITIKVYNAWKEYQGYELLQADVYKWLSLGHSKDIVLKIIDDVIRKDK